MEIVVTGASGFVAKNTRQFLSENGFDLVSISRNNFKQFPNEKKIVSKNYSEKDILSKIKNYDVLLHLVGIGKQTTKNDYHTINLEFTKKIIKLCRKANIKKIIFLSGLGVSNKTTLGYFISKYKSEQEIIDSKLDYTILRPSYIIGKDDYLSKTLKKQMSKNQILIPGSGKYCIQPISISDVTQVFKKVIQSSKFNKKIFDLVGPEIISYEKFVKLFCKSSKVEFKKINLEDAYYKAINNLSSDFEVDDLNILVGDFRGDHKKLQKMCKFKFKPVKDF